MQDRTGYIWAGIYWGIIRYDGNSFKAYVPNHAILKDSTDLIGTTNLYVQAICEDNDGNLWVGHTMGIERFDPVTEKFKHYVLNPSMPLSDWSNHVLALCIDHKGNLWVGSGSGLYLFDRTTEKFKRYLHDSTDTNSIVQNSINAIYEDRSGNLWVGTGGGLDKLDSSGKKFSHYWTAPKNSDTWGSMYWIMSIFEDRDGIIWLGTQNGLVEFDKSGGSFITYKNIPNDSKSLGSNGINCICQDKNGFIWISTNEGLDILDKKTKKFAHFRTDESDPSSISNYIAQILVDRSGTIWIGSRGDGLNKCIPPNPYNKNYPFEGYCNSNKCLVEDLSGKIWIGTNIGLISFDPKTECFKKENSNMFISCMNIDNSGTLWVSSGPGNLFYKKEKENVFNRLFIGKTSDEYILSMRNSRDGNMWVGTARGQVFKLNIHTREIEKIFQYNHAIVQVYEDKNGLLWLGTNEAGVIRYNPETKKSTSFTSNPNDTLTLSGNDVYDFCEDGAGNLWVITNANINKFDKKLQKFVRMFGKEGFKGDALSMVTDEHGNLWLCNIDGFIKYNPINKQHKLYNEIKVGYIFRGRKGELYVITAPFFKEKQKMIIVNPDHLQNNLFNPPIVITSFKKFEEPYPFGKEIKLSYNQNFISFEFSALSYIQSEKNQYAYIMEGIDNNWVYSGTRHYASYPNLSPGKYIFRVKGSNNDGVWNEMGTSIAIIISPPWWKTWWAYCSYAFIFVFALLGIRKYELNRLKLKDKVKMDEAVLKEREETDKMKSRFFANISHEFRTPLTLILGPAQKILKKESTDIMKEVNIIARNSNRLLQLVNQLLDLSKIESGKLKLEASKGNIVSFVKGVALSFESLSESKDIVLKIESEKEYLEVYFDKEKMTKILSNILSNSFKFTPEEGKITISILEANQSKVEIKIKDTGIGILREEIPKLFDRFYQVDSSHTREYEGTGIGLALTKELVELHHGRILVESELGKWTEFTILLPMGREHLIDEELKEKESESKVILNEAKNLLPTTNYENQIETDLLDSSSPFERLRIPQNEATVSEDKNIILVVEDNYDMREYIKEFLVKDYIVEEALNGEQALRKAEKIIPDLIISDMMMPKMDGNELTRRLKKDVKTSHIPIIILTAKSGQENKLEGLKTGADDYLTKPFDVKELHIRIENLIKIRKNLQEKYSKGEQINHEEKKLRKIDEEFLKKVLKIVEENLSDENFSIEEFSSEIGMSRTQLHRKLKALIGKSASSYVRTIRLTKAKKMIEEEKGNISEIAYSVGFSSPAYFTRCFKKEFGYPPSDLDR